MFLPPPIFVEASLLKVFKYLQEINKRTRTVELFLCCLVNLQYNGVCFKWPEAGGNVDLTEFALDNDNFFGCQLYTDVKHRLTWNRVVELGEAVFGENWLQDEFYSDIMIATRNLVQNHFNNGMELYKPVLNVGAIFPCTVVCKGIVCPPGGEREDSETDGENEDESTENLSGK